MGRNPECLPGVKTTLIPDEFSCKNPAWCYYPDYVYSFMKPADIDDRLITAEDIFLYLLTSRVTNRHFGPADRI